MKNFYNDKQIKKKLIWIVLFNLFFLIHGLWVPFYNIDEITNALFARFILNGDLSLKDFLGNPYLITHYIYVFLFKLWNENSLVLIHVFHMFYRGLTAIAVYYFGKELKDERVGLWSAFLFSCSGVAFMSKDFHTPSAESFSLLPAALATTFLFKFWNQNQKKRWLFLSGIFVGIAALCKAPMGIILIVFNLFLLFGESVFRNVILLNLGFSFVTLIPVVLVQPLGAGIYHLMVNMQKTGGYIQVHSNIMFLYWVLKFILRSALVFGASAFATIFSFLALADVFSLKKSNKSLWKKLFLIVFCFVSTLFVTTIGKRIFFHYFVFCLPFSSVLAGYGLCRFNPQLFQRPFFTKRSIAVLTFLKKKTLLFCLLPVCIFFLEGSLNFSTKPDKTDRAIEYIKSHTAPDDRIYVWGNMPQLYFYSGRLPALTNFWTESLVGNTNSSPAMEYVMATKEKLRVIDLLAKDLEAKSIQKNKPSEILKRVTSLRGLFENDLLTIEELSEITDEPHWKRFLNIFVLHPPKLIIDTSPANIRGYAYYPMEKYPLMKAIILSKYQLKTYENGLAIYALKENCSAPGHCKE